MANINQKFGKRIAELRQSKNWSQEDLADETGLSVRSIYNIEKGIFSITLENIEKLAKAFRMKLSELLDFHKQ